LNAIGMVKEYLDDSFMKMLVLPRAKALFHKTNNVRVNITQSVFSYSFMKMLNVC